MILYAITIEATPNGVVTNCFTVKPSTDPAERQMAGILDHAIQAASEWISTEITKAAKCSSSIITGEHIEEHVKKILNETGAHDLRQALIDSGYEFPK